MEALYKLIIVVILFLITFWLLVEAVGYVPTNIYIPEVLSNLYKTKESFIASIIYQKTPSYSGDDDSVNSVIDTSVLKSLRTYDYLLFSKTLELDFFKMNKIVTRMLEFNKANIADENIIKLSESDLRVVDIDTSGKDLTLEKALLHFQIALNKQVSTSEFNSPYHQYEPYKLLNYKLIEKSQSLDNTYNRYKLHIHMGRPFKTHMFMFYTNVIINADNTSTSFLFKDLEIIGIPIEFLDSNINDEFIKSRLNKSEPSLDDVFVNYPIIGSYDKPNDDITIFEQKKDYDETLKSYKCFHPKGIYGELPNYYNEIACTSYHPEVDGVGIWDKPCSKNEDCPFYQANKNYTNEFGGCETETKRCQMPLGITRIGYREYSKAEKPMCYNCKVDNPD